MDLYITTYILISEKKVIVDDQLRFYKENFINFADFIKSLYKQEGIVYPKFYKMDNLSKLGFMAAELILGKRDTNSFRKEETGIVLANSSASLDTDIIHQESIKDRSRYFPSPSVFVYTLPNIVIGEICIKHKIKGENAFFVSETFEPQILVNYVSEMMGSNRVQACLCGWVEMMGGKYEALMCLVEKEQSSRPFTADIMKQIIERN